MQTTHEAIAATLAADVPADAVTVTRCLRQGDLMAERVGDHDPKAEHVETPHGGIQLAAGVHGEHRLVGPAVAALDGGFVSLAEPAVVVHTDVPDARHAPVRMTPGVWRYWRLRELTADQVVVQVED